MNEKQFLKEQWLQLIFAASIILLSCILTPSNSQDDRVTIFGFKTPILCLHRLIYNKPCPGCGLTRSFVCFAHGDIRTSYNYHRLGIPLFIIILLQIPIRLYLLRVGSSGYTPLIKKIIFFPPVICMIALVINWFFIYISLFLQTK